MAAEPQVKVDRTKPRSERPMVGLDIEEWRSELGLPKYDAQVALGFRNSNHYNKMCNSPLLELSTELIIRLYDELPVARGWERYSLPELFDLMYGKALKPFVGTPQFTYAKVDLGSRFCRLFGRSPGAHYRWLKKNRTNNPEALLAYSDVATILSKLKQFGDPAEVFERLAVKTYALRGVDLNEDFPVPTVTSPPKREKTGRKAKVVDESAAQGQSKSRLKSAAAKTRKLALKKVTPLKKSGRAKAAKKTAAAR